MADNPYPWLSPSLFYQFSQEVGLNYHCSKCSALPKLHYFDAGAEDGYVPRSSSYTNTDQGFVNMSESRHIPCVRITCTHCGHIDLYSIFAVAAWRDRKIRFEMGQQSLFPAAIPDGQ